MDKDKSISVMLHVLDQLHPLSTAARLFLQSNCTIRVVEKRELLLKEGECCDHIYFILNGAVRGFIREGGKDITTWITVENEMVSSIAALETRAPVSENIQTLNIVYCWCSNWTN